MQRLSQRFQQCEYIYILCCFFGRVTHNSLLFIVFLQIANLSIMLSTNNGMAIRIKQVLLCNSSVEDFNNKKRFNCIRRASNSYKCAGLNQLKNCILIQPECMLFLFIINNFLNITDIVK